MFPRADGVAKIGTRLKVADIRHGNEHLYPTIHRQAKGLARGMDDTAGAQGGLDLVECL